MKISHLLAVIMVFAFCSLALAATTDMPISVKAGLAGGALRVAGVVEKPINDKMTAAADLGYGIGNQYSVITAGISGKYLVKENIYAGLGLGYSSYSDPVLLSGATITDKAGVGFGAFVGTTVRESMTAQVGFDTRLGILAEVCYRVK